MRNDSTPLQVFTVSPSAEPPAAAAPRGPRPRHERTQQLTSAHLAPPPRAPVMQVVLEAPIPAYEPPAEPAPVPLLLGRRRAGTGAPAVATLWSRVVAWLRAVLG